MQCSTLFSTACTLLWKEVSCFAFAAYPLCVSNNARLNYLVCVWSLANWQGHIMGLHIYLSQQILWYANKRSSTQHPEAKHNWHQTTHVWWTVNHVAIMHAVAKSVLRRAQATSPWPTPSSLISNSQLRVEKPLPFFFSKHVTPYPLVLVIIISSLLTAMISVLDKPVQDMNTRITQPKLQVILVFFNYLLPPLQFVSCSCFYRHVTFATSYTLLCLDTLLNLIYVSRKAWVIFMI
jgi:hypothetical protein